MPEQYEYDEFEAIAVARDLVRKPEVRTLALALARFNAPKNSQKITVDNIPAIWIIFSHRLLSHPTERAAILALVDMLS
jgi:hypothetical protein